MRKKLIVLLISFAIFSGYSLTIYAENEISDEQGVYDGKIEKHDYIYDTETVADTSADISEDNIYYNDDEEYGENYVNNTANVLENDNSEYISYGKFGDNITWRLSSDYVLTISGNGQMNGQIPDFTYDFGNVNPNKARKMIIEEGITTIDFKFASFKNLNSVILPETVTSIGDYAFAWCSMLYSINLPNSITSIRKFAFWGCDLRSITIPEKITDIEDGTFSQCMKLEEINLPDNLRTIGGRAFSLTNISSISIPNGVTTIGPYAFEQNFNLESVTIPRSVVSIEEGVFSTCFHMKYLTILSEDIVIGDFAFPTSYLNHIHIPYGKNWNDYKGKGGLPTNKDLYYPLNVEGFCFDQQCPMHISIQFPTPEKPTVKISAVFGGRTVQLNCADTDAEIYYGFGSSNITLSCSHVKAGETIFLNEPMTGNKAAMYFKAYKNGKWSPLGKWGVLNVQIAKPIITQSGKKADNNFKVYTQTKDSYIVYTLDGTVPSINEGTQKLSIKNGRIIWGTSGIVKIPQGKTIKAIAIRNGLVTSDVMTYTNK